MRFTKLDLEIMRAAMIMTGGDFDNDYLPDALTSKDKRRAHKQYLKALSKLDAKLNKAT